ncbi:hypothetical protein Mx4_p54 [Myxococcus phage Mx4]|nr:hypothetical protein Mx4_p54 [Myxococcus phage Mx4]
MSGVEQLVGEEHLAAAKLRPPAVIWVPSGDSFAAGHQRGGPKSLRTRAVGLQVLCWAVSEERTAEADMRAAEALVERLIWAVEDSLGGSWDVSAGAWQANAAKVQLGRMYVLALTVELPVTRPESRATVTAVQPESQLGADAP